MNPSHLNDCSDMLLLQLLKENNAGSFEKIYERYWETTFNNAYCRVKDRAQAKDIVQEIFTHLWVKRETLSIDNLPAYLHIAVRNKVFKIVSRARLSHPYLHLLENAPSSGHQPDARLLWQEFASAFEKLLQQLPAGKQLIFRLRYQEDLSTADIATRLGLSRKTVQNQLGRALEQLRMGIFYCLAFLLFLVQK